MIRRFLNMFRAEKPENEDLVFDLEMITGRAVTTMTDERGRTGFVFTSAIQKTIAEAEAQGEVNPQEFALAIVTRTNAILARYDSPICDRAREINADILMT